LSAGAGAVYFIGHQKLAEYRALNEAEGSFAAVALVENFGAKNIGGHEIRRELDALVIEPHDGTQCFHKTRLAKAGNADQQNVTAGKQRDKSFINYLLLAEDHASDVVTDKRHSLPQRLDFSNETSWWASVSVV